MFGVERDGWVGCCVRGRGVILLCVYLFVSVLLFGFFL